MPEFKYVAIDDSGKKAEGILKASDETTLERTLQAQGYYLLTHALAGDHLPSAEPSSYVQTPSFGLGKLLLTLFLTWCTPFTGLGNLIFLFRDRGRRKGAIISLVISVILLLALVYIKYSVNPAHIRPDNTQLLVKLGTFFLLYFPIVFSLAIWMSISAIRAYREYG